jgi:hypothetical protein
MLACRAWQVVSVVNLNHFVTARGYTFFIGMLHIMVVWPAGGSGTVHLGGTAVPGQLV